jgi:Zn-dependent protease with chaperone function
MNSIQAWLAAACSSAIAVTSTISRLAQSRRTAGYTLPLLVAALLNACASTAPGGRSQLSAPAPLGSLYSSLDLNLTLASLSGVSVPCAGVQCEVDKGFERQVERIGTRLAESAYSTYPDLRLRVPQFRFVVAEKTEGGSTSDASGTIVIYRGVRKAPLEEETLAYLMASEMSHVIAGHHEEKSATAFWSSLLVHVLLSPANLARGVAFLASSTASTFGKKLMSSGADADRLKEADVIALALLKRQGWADQDVSDSLRGYADRLGHDAWAGEVRRMSGRLDTSLAVNAFMTAQL